MSSPLDRTKYRIVRHPTYGITVQEWKRSLLYNFLLGGWVYIWNSSGDWPASWKSIEAAKEWIKSERSGIEVLEEV